MQCAALLGSVSGIKVSKSFGRGTGRIGKGAQFKNRTSTRSRSMRVVPTRLPTTGILLPVTLYRGSNGLAAGRESTEGGRPNRVDR